MGSANGGFILSEIKFKGRNIPSKKHIYSMMKNNQVMNTHEIHNELKSRGKRLGLSMNSLSNIMARSPHYEKLGFEYIPNAFGSYQIIIWGFRYGN